MTRAGDRNHLILLNDSVVLGAHGLNSVEDLCRGRGSKSLDEVVLVSDDAALVLCVRFEGA